MDMETITMMVTLTHEKAITEREKNARSVCCEQEAHIKNSLILHLTPCFYFAPSVCFFCLICQTIVRRSRCPITDDCQKSAKTFLHRHTGERKNVYKVS